MPTGAEGAACDVVLEEGTARARWGEGMDEENLEYILRMRIPPQIQFQASIFVSSELRGILH